MSRLPPLSPFLAIFSSPQAGRRIGVSGRRNSAAIKRLIFDLGLLKFAKLAAPSS